MPTQQEINDLKDRVATSCRIIGNQGLTRGAFGHVSARIPGTDRVLIKSKGPQEEAVQFATPRDIITIDIEGAVLEAADGLDAPNETAMHLAIYRRRPEVMSVIHCHPDWIVALTAAEKPLVPMFGAYNPGAMRLCVDGIPVYPRSLTIVNDELGDDFMKTMGTKDACLLRGHGLTAAGRSVEDCTSRSLTVYELARMNYLAYAIGTPNPIPQRDIDEYRDRSDSGEERRRRPDREGVPGEQSSGWRYQKKLLARQGL
jgi:ribulose-5-phosphate 4-epimerase/fuculose-1-phosphate aldolase